MAQNFIACDRDQVLLLAPDLGEWLPAGHLARFVIAVVEQLDLSGVYDYYRQDGRGRPAHDPAMMVALVLYAYAVGVTSSRAIERRCVEDVAFRVISVNQQPDHSTVARFLIRHRDAIQGLFSQVLVLCQRAGMVHVGTVAVDSTKLASNASMGQNRTLAGLEALAGQIIDEAIETDRLEDELYGSARGDELPEELADASTRSARIKELLEQARAEQAQAQAEREEKLAAYQPDPVTGKRPRGRPPKPEGGHRENALFAKKYNLTDPDSGIVRHRGMLLQGYNIQTVTSEDQIILATAASNLSSDGGQLQTMIAIAEETLQAAGIDQRPEQVLADAGYWNTRQIQAVEQNQRQVLIPPPRTSRSPAADRMRARLAAPDRATAYAQRKQIIEPVFARMKHHRGITRLWRRGRTAIQAEMDLIATTHNLLKLRTALQST